VTVPVIPLGRLAPRETVKIMHCRPGLRARPPCRNARPVMVRAERAASPRPNRPPPERDDRSLFEPSHDRKEWMAQSTSERRGSQHAGAARDLNESACWSCLNYIDDPREAIMATAKWPNNPNITKMNIKPNTFKLFSTNAGIRSDEFIYTINVPHIIGMRARV